MSIGFLPTNNRRQPIYGEQVSRKVGYVEHSGTGIFFQTPDGRRVARVIRYKEYQAPCPKVQAVSNHTVSYSNLGV
jgi:hypothetical protein